MNKKNLQPWLDYFGMLQRYQDCGFLLMEPQKHEAYITQPAMMTLTQNIDSEVSLEHLSHAIPIIVRRLRTYAAFLAQEGKGYMEQNFAMNVVKDVEPNDPLYTVLLTRRRRWFCPWRKLDHYETIVY